MAYTEEQIENIKTRILTALEEVIDPELGIDIVNLGLIYEIRFDGDTGQTEIDMTLTTMGCPLPNQFDLSIRYFWHLCHGIINLVRQKVS